MLRRPPIVNWSYASQMEERVNVRWAGIQRVTSPGDILYLDERVEKRCPDLGGV